MHNPQNALYWQELRTWLEEPNPAAPSLSRAHTYCLKRVLRELKASSMVARYLARAKHRGRDAQVPTWAQLQLVLPVFAAPGFEASNEARGELPF